MDELDMWRLPSVMYYQTMFLLHAAGIAAGAILIGLFVYWTGDKHG